MRKADFPKLQGDPRINHADDETAWGDGYWLHLRPGFGVKSDPGSHTIHEWTLRKTLQRYRTDIALCDCPNCSTEPERT